MRRVLSRGALCLGVLAVPSCSAPGSEEPAKSEHLVDHGLWSLVVTPEADPFAATRGRPVVHACEPGAYFMPTAHVFEVELARCRERYVSLHQVSLAAIQPGDSLQFELSHLLLRPLTESVTEAYLALSVDGQVIWEVSIQILAPSSNYMFSAPVSTEAQVGSDVVLHLDNHGENSYSFSQFVIERGDGS